MVASGEHVCVRRWADPMLDEGFHWGPSGMLKGYFRV